jgi:hypothetical protein
LVGGVVVIVGWSQYLLRYAVICDSETFEGMLAKTVTLPDGIATTVGSPKCGFGVTLHVYAKHCTDGDRIQGYDHQETASFAPEITS